jgi:hypothetical protein
MSRVGSTNAEQTNAFRIFVGKPGGRWIILKLILEKQDGVVWTGLIWLRIGPVEGSCEDGNKLLGSIKFRDVLQ